MIGFELGDRILDAVDERDPVDGAAGGIGGGLLGRNGGDRRKSHHDGIHE